MVWKWKTIQNGAWEKGAHLTPGCSSEHVKISVTLPDTQHQQSENGFRTKWTWSALVAASSGVPVSALNASQTLLSKYTVKILGVGWNRILANDTVEKQTNDMLPQKENDLLKKLLHGRAISG